MGFNYFKQWRVDKGLNYAQLHKIYGINRLTWRKLENNKGVKPRTLHKIYKITKIPRSILDDFAEPPFSNSEKKCLSFCRRVPLMDASDIAVGLCEGWPGFCDAIADTIINGSKKLEKKKLERVNINHLCNNSRCHYSQKCYKFMKKPTRYQSYMPYNKDNGICSQYIPLEEWHKV